MREESGRFGEEETHVSSQAEDLQPLLSEQQAGDSSAVFNVRFISPNWCQVQVLHQPLQHVAKTLRDRVVNDKLKRPDIRLQPHKSIQIINDFIDESVIDTRTFNWLYLKRRLCSDYDLVTGEIQRAKKIKMMLTKTQHTHGRVSRAPPAVLQSGGEFSLP